MRFLVVAAALAVSSGCRDKSDHRPAAPGAPTVTSARFLPPDPAMIGGPWALSVVAQGHGFVERALPLQGVVGTVQVQAIYQSPQGDGFVGYLKEMPTDGDRLSIGYERLTPTPIVFHAETTPGR